MSKGIQAEGTCTECKTRFRWKEDAKVFLCSCGKAPARYTIYIWHEGERITRGTDFDGNTLTEHWQAQQLIYQAEQEKKYRKFDVTKWKSKRRMEYRFDKLFDRYVDELEASKGRKTAIWNAYKKFEPYHSLDVREIQNTKDLFRKITGAPSYRALILNTLKGFFSYCIEEKVLTEHPVYPKIEIPDRESNPLSFDLAMEIINEIPKQHQPIFKYMVLQGARPNEIRALKWDAIDIQNEVVTYKRAFDMDRLVEWAKGGKMRDNYLFPETVEILPPRGLPDAFVFTSDGKTYPHRRLVEIYSLAKDKVIAEYAQKGKKIEIKTTLYEFGKHSFGTRMADLGVDPFTIQKWYGHSSIKMTEKYMKMNMINSFKTQMAGKVVPISKPSVKNHLQMDFCYAMIRQKRGGDGNEEMDYRYCCCLGNCGNCYCGMLHAYYL